MSGRYGRLSVVEMSHPPVLALVAGEDWHFLTHRLGLALAARDAGWRVIAVVPPGARHDDIRALGFEVESVPISRALGAPWVDLLAVWRLRRVFRRQGVTLVHAFALKPVLLSALAALCAVPVVATVSGMGYLFIAGSLKAKLIRGSVLKVLRLLLDRSRRRVIVQNQDDWTAVTASMVQSDRAVLIRGSGVDCRSWLPSPEPSGVPLAVLPARMLWDKGVGETVEAARLLRQRGVALRIALVGDVDPGNPRSIERARLEAWQAEGVVEWWGHQRDMRDVWRQAHIAVLPSYREGLPKALLEAGACGRPAIATDVPGCRELIEDGANGLLVPAQSAEPLADALQRLASDPVLRRRLGQEARRRVEAEFSDPVVHAAILAVYTQVLAD